MEERESIITLHNTDCITGMAAMEPDTIHLSVTSIPFEELFTYSGKLEDVGNNGSTINLREGRFALNLRFWIEGLFRVTKPGRLACVHIQELLAYKNQHGFMGKRDFGGALIDLFYLHGWKYEGRAVIAKNPQAMAQRLSLHSLMFITGRRDATALAPCPNDYVMFFKKDGLNADPVPCLYDPTLNPVGWVSCEEWIKWACGIWDDIDEFDILSGARQAKENGEEKHVCELQLEVIRRCIALYSNPGDLVMDPFMGIGSTAHVAIGGATKHGDKLRHGRDVVGFELKESYHKQSLRRIELTKERLRSKGELFDRCEPQPVEVPA